jgi:Uma2 family endonuclease
MIVNVSEAAKRATYQDVLDAPEQLVAEVIDGVLYTQPRPRVGHGIAATRLAGVLDGRFGADSSDPQGWVVLAEPELHLEPEPDIVVPDLAAWHRARFPSDLDAPFLTVEPDWICEVLSPSTARKDRTIKLPRYARAGVRWAWLLDPSTRVLEVYALDGDAWRLVGSHADDAVVHAVPFDGAAIELRRLWIA